MSKIENINIKNYRGIQELNITGLKSVNILVGDNNAGKTSLLEAIQVFLNPNLPTLAKIATERESVNKAYGSKERMHILDSLYYLFNIKKPTFFSINGIVNKKIEKVEINVEKRKMYQIGISKKNLNKTNKFNEIDSYVYSFKLNNTKETIELNKYTDQLFKVEKSKVNLWYVKAIDHLIDDPFSELLKTKDIKDKAVKLLKNFDDNIMDIRYIPTENDYNIPMIEVVNGEYLPVVLYGDGLKKALTMLNAIIKAENGVLLVDEYETALHTSIMEKVFKFMVEVAKKENVQLFLTTHSLEAVDKFLYANEDMLEDISIIRLKKKENKTYAKIMNGKEALDNRENYDLELRV